MSELDRRSIMGRIHSVLPGAAVDGPGLRYLIFLTGCAFRCLYCHNPDTWKLQAGQEKTVGQMFDAIKSYYPFLSQGGGVTVSGGEPLTQADFVHALFLELKEKLGLHTAIDTNGNLASRLSDSWFDPVDLVILDIKHMDEAKHKHLTGFPLGPTLETAKRLSELGKDLWIRYVVVPGLTDEPETAARMAEFVKGLKTVQRVELLPFHQMGSHKWKELGYQYTLENTPEATEIDLEPLRSEFLKQGIVTG